MRSFRVLWQVARNRILRPTLVLFGSSALCSSVLDDGRLLFSEQRSFKVDDIKISRNFLVRSKPIDEFADDYEILNKIGEGGFATIYKVFHKPTRTIRVAKIVEVRTQSDLDIFRNEVDVMTQLDSPYIGRIVEYFVDGEVSHGISSRKPSNHAVMISHYIEGIDLLDTINEMIKRRSRFSDQEICIIARQILKSLAYLHSQGFVHRDIKPENYVCGSGPADRLTLKLIDHGLTSKLGSHRSPMESAGTSFYSAPETFSNRRYCTEKSDVWSVGVILATVASCGTALIGRTTSMGGKGIQSGFDDAFIGKELSKLRERNIDPVVIDLIAMLLNRDPNTRPSAREALLHPALRNSYQNEGSPNMEEIGKEVKVDLRRPLMSRIVRLIMAHHTNDSDIPNAQLRFRCLDTDADGHVVVDADGRIELTFEEFLSKFLPSHIVENSEFINYVFKEISRSSDTIRYRDIARYLAISDHVARKVLDSCNWLDPTREVDDLTLDQFRKCVVDMVT
jgi:serine/threonine protein kinase